MPKGLWVWTTTPVTDAVARQELLDFAVAHAVTRVFVHAGTGAPVLTRNLMQESPAALMSFLDDAAAVCVEVELLFGDPGWTLADRHERPIGLAAQAVTFAASLPGARPIGLHLDVEAHGIHGISSEGTTWDWSNDGTDGTPNQQIEMVGQYLEMLEAVRDTLAGSGLELSADIPFWYDSQSAAFNPLTFLGDEKLASEHVVDVVDRAVLMDYRDTAFGSGSSAANSANGIYDLAASEVAYATASAGRVVIGVETIGCTTNDDGALVLDGSMPDYLTFCDEGAAATEAQLDLVADAFAGQSGLDGYAVHHWGSYGDPLRMAP